MTEVGDTSSSPTGPGRSSGVGERLRTYLIGVGIGVTLLGMFWMMKRQATRNQAAQNQAGPNQGAPASGQAPVPATK